LGWTYEDPKLERLERTPGRIVDGMIEKIHAIPTAKPIFWVLAGAMRIPRHPMDRARRAASGTLVGTVLAGAMRIPRYPIDRARRAASGTLVGTVGTESWANR
ncbi:unnamed protein product, partial [Adineta ricciae]